MTSRLRLTFVAAVCFAAVACGKPEQPNPEASAKAFAQEFYQWYVPALQRDRKEPAFAFAIHDRSAWINPALVRALEADEAAQAKVTGEVVGIDFDPFTASQDPCDHYIVGALRRIGIRYLAPVYCSRAGARDSAPTVFAEMIAHESTWQFVNFRYPGPPATDLTAVLKRLAEDREKPASAKRK